jgi:hypothetical protein
LKRLELIDIPLWQDASSRSLSSGGITIQALWSLLRSCSGITHLSLSGCFDNWEDVATSEREDIGVFLGGNQSLSSLSHCIEIMGKRHGKDDDAGVHNLLPCLDFYNVFEEITDGRSLIPAINSMLPDLRVLDVSHCGWVTPEMVVRLLLNGWKRCLASTPDVGQWGEAAEKRVGNRKSATLEYPTLRHISIRGCTGLISGTSQPSWMEEWRRTGLFDGIDISIDRHIRLK